MLDPRLRRQLDDLGARLGLPPDAVQAVADWLASAFGADTLPPEVADPATEPGAAPIGDDPRYERIALLGRGGFGEVWRVRDRVLQRTLALKVLRPRPSARQTDLLAEARAAARLRHPAIVTVYDVGVLPDGGLFYTMEEVGGATLVDRLPAGTGPALRRLIGALASVAQGLAYAHDRGVIHRDVKPQNIVLGSYGEVRLLDFGAGVLGTAAYLAPERVAGGPATPATDQYALGATLYHVIAGRPPFDGSSDAVVEAVRTGPPAPLVGPRELVGPELVGIVARAMDRDPDRRFPGCGALADALLGFLEGAKAEDRARERIADARLLAPQIDALRVEADALRDQARTALDAVPRHAPSSAKEPGWALEDRARALDEQRARTEVAFLQALQHAESEAPHLDDVHVALADHWQRRHAALEATGDPAAASALAWLRIHDRGHHAAYLRGLGALTVRSTPGARALLFRVEVEGRRRVCRFDRELGPTPCEAVPGEHG
ncbi:MAG: serine/threonine-protein kinase, partial [Myxococcota bacterium]